jgi:hypothetical protein
MNVVQFPKHKAVFQPFAHFIRLGEGSYRRVANLIAAGTLTSKRVVVDASKAAHQHDLIEMLRGRGTEIVLDPRTVELSSRQKCGGLAAGAPWASQEKGTPLTPELFRRGHSADIYGQIARVCVELRVDAVLAPTQFLGDPSFDGWYRINVEGCDLMRAALDAAGGAGIRIDYLLAARLSDLCKPDFQRQFLLDLPSMPVDNLWLRLSMAPIDNSPINAQRLIGTLAGWHNVGVPIIMDYVGGLAGEALVSMNVVSGIAHGFGEETSFNTSNWNEVPKERDKSEDGDSRGRAQRVSVTALGRTFTTKEMDVLLSAHGARSLLIPNDRHIAPNGAQDIQNDARRFNAADAERRLIDISKIPTVDRPEFFAQNRMREVASTAKRAEKLNPRADVAKANNVDLAKLQKRLANQRQIADSMRETFEDIATDRKEQGFIAKEIGSVRQATGLRETGTR